VTNAKLFSGMVGALVLVSSLVGCVVGVDPQHGLVRLQLAWRPQGRLLRPGTRELADDIEIVTSAAQGPHALTLALAVAAAAFIVAINVGYRNKKPEGSLLVWMSALLFVLPAFCGMLPGNPPLGVLSDYLVFFWVEGLVALCLLVAVLAWARRGTAG
jgi:hypothetical protein